MTKNNSIQIFRFILFFIILCFHCGVPFFNMGWIGVETFFVISAFFLAKKYYQSDICFGKETKKRVVRLTPPYLIVIIIGLIYAAFVRKIPLDFFSHLFFVQNIHWMFTGYVSPMQPITAHTWTLSIELLCDLVLLLLFRFQKNKKYPFYIMLFVGIVWRTTTIIFGLNNYVVSLCPLAHFDSFALGALLAISKKEDNNKTWFNIIMFILGMVGVLSCVLVTSFRQEISFLESYKSYNNSSNYLNNWFTGNIYLFVSLISVGIVGLLERKDISKTSWVKAALAKLGDNSYCMYLFHWPFLFILNKVINKWYITLPIVLTLSIVSSLIFSKLLLLVKNKKKLIFYEMGGY